MELAFTLAGLALFLFPGIAWAQALAPRLAWQASVALGAVLAFTIAPMAMFVLDLFFDVPITPATSAYLTASLGLVAVAVRLAGPLLRGVVA